MKCVMTSNPHTITQNAGGISKAYMKVESKAIGRAGCMDTNTGSTIVSTNAIVAIKSRSIRLLTREGLTHVQSKLPTMILVKLGKTAVSGRVSQGDWTDGNDQDPTGTAVGHNGMRMH